MGAERQRRLCADRESVRAKHQAVCNAETMLAAAVAEIMAA
jgi:hypothetical protein